MTISITKKITELEVFNNENNVVCKIHVSWKVHDDEVEDNIPDNPPKIFTLEVDSENPISSDFVSFEDLTEDIIFGWIEERLNTPRIKAMEQRMLEEYLSTISEPEIAVKQVPWK